MQHPKTLMLKEKFYPSKKPAPSKPFNFLKAARTKFLKADRTKKLQQAKKPLTFGQELEKRKKLTATLRKRRKLDRARGVEEKDINY